MASGPIVSHAGAARDKRTRRAGARGRRAVGSAGAAAAGAGAVAWTFAKSETGLNRARYAGDYAPSV